MNIARKSVSSIFRFANDMATRIGQRDGRLDQRTLARYRDHVIDVARRTPLGREPFAHLYLEDVLPPDLFTGLHELMLAKLSSGALLGRPQDNPLYTNRRFPLYRSTNIHALYLRALFSDTAVVEAFTERFYLDRVADLARSLSIFDGEFEFAYSDPGRFQNIHVDIPPKYLSFVLYFPDSDLTAEQEVANGTLLYDAEMRPVRSAQYRPNSGVCFAPHFATYHGFSTTMTRQVLVIFLVNRNEMTAWNATKPKEEEPPFTHWGDCIEQKMLAHPLREFGTSPSVIARARASSRVNAPEGRVLLEHADDAI